MRAHLPVIRRRLSALVFFIVYVGAVVVTVLDVFYWRP